MAKVRETVEERLKWKLEDIYPSDAAFETDLAHLENLMKLIPGIREKLTPDVGPKALARCLAQIEKMEHIAAQLFVYARMRRDENNSIARYQAMTAQAMDINVRLSSELSFVNPALVAMKKSRLEAYIKAAHIFNMPDGAKKRKKMKKLLKKGYGKKALRVMGRYDFMMEEVVRYKPHVLSAPEERILAMAGQVTTAPKDIFGMLNDADLRFGTVKDADGKEVELTHGSYILLMQSSDRNVRREAYNQLYAAYRSFINTISTTYAASVHKDIFVAHAKEFRHAIDRALFADNVPVALYRRLINIIHDNLDIMYKYVALRKKLLGVEELYMYDVYAPLIPNQQKQYGYDEAVQLVKDGLHSLGPVYQELLNRAVDERWIDVEETTGKTSGAYSWGVYGVHPYVLLNHRGDLDSVFTIAHELGHAMHSYFSNLNQPESKADYSIFVAEVASTVNEILLTKHLLATTTDLDERLNILNHYLDQFRTTVVRQTMFAEFERMTHEASEDGRPLTHDSLCEMYGELNALYYGPEMQTDDRIIYEWARIPHFYNAFYVYKYATGFSCAVKIATDIASGKKDAVRDYIRFLSSGGSDYPLELLKIAHVDLLEGEPIRECMREFSRTLDEFTEALKQKQEAESTDSQDQKADAVEDVSSEPHDVAEEHDAAEPQDLISAQDSEDAPQDQPEDPQQSGEAEALVAPETDAPQPASDSAGIADEEAAESEEQSPASVTDAQETADEPSAEEEEPDAPDPADEEDHSAADDDEYAEQETFDELQSVTDGADAQDGEETSGEQKAPGEDDAQEHHDSDQEQKPEAEEHQY